MFRRAGIKTDSFILQTRDRDYHGGEITLLILTVVFGTFAPVGTAPTLTDQNTVNVNDTMLAVSSEFGFDGDPPYPLRRIRPYGNWQSKASRGRECPESSTGRKWERRYHAGQ